MSVNESIDGASPSNSSICPRCSTPLPPVALFCSSCGERIKKKKNEEVELRTENGDNDAHERGGDETVRLPLLLRAQLKRWQSSQSFKNNGITGQIDKSGALPQDIVAPTFQELNAPSIPVPDVGAQEHAAVPLSQHVDMKLLRGETPEVLMLSNGNSAGSKTDTWGYLPALSVTSAVGVFLVALAYNGGRVSAGWSEPAFWFGLLVLVLPTMCRLISGKLARRERIALLVVLGISLYFVKFLQYPLYFAYYDEFTHWRTALTITVSGHLFQESPLLPISSFYPGLEIAANALSSLTGLSIFGSGILLIGAIRLAFVLALYLFYEHLSNSPRAAGIATLLYIANPGFLFFDADFAYESLALPLAVFVLFAVAFRSYGPAGRHRGLTLAIWLGLGAVVITHHITSYALVVFLLLWTVISFYQSRAQKDQAGPGPGDVGLLGLALCLVWMAYTGYIVVSYLTPHFTGILQQIGQILVRESAPRQLFQNSSGYVTPLWERALGFASVALILLGLPFGLFQIWRHHRANAAALALAVGVLAYPVSQVLRLTPAGAETGYRATEFLFVGIAFVLAIGATEFWLHRTQSWRLSVLFMGAVGIVCFGQMILGIGTGAAPLPGPYLVSADALSIEPEGITAAEWAHSYLGPRHRIGSDRINTLLMATYGDEQVVMPGSGNLPVAQVFTSLHVGPAVVEILQQDRIQYLVVDHRLSTALPQVGTYFNQPPAGTHQYIKPIDPAALAKFGNVKYVSRVFDSGNIVIYDVEAIVNGSSANNRPPPHALCTLATAASGSYPHIATHYTGTLHDIPTGLTTNISFTGIQQQQRNICGYFGGMPTSAMFNSTLANGPFSGSISADKQVQFIVISDTGHATFSFDGVLQSDGAIAGTYCSLAEVPGKCSDYGLWIVSPAA